jgi:hypothetical protein
MDLDALTFTIEARPRRWWWPLRLRALPVWYREARRQHGRLFSAVLALLIARLEFSISGKAVEL